MPVPAEFTEVAARVRNWGRWGADDEIGTLNLVDDEARRRGVASVVSGRAFALGLPLSEAEGIQLGFIEGRVNPTRTMVQVNVPVNAEEPDWVCFSEDVLTLATQCATHWDALAHSSYGGVIYNGYPAGSVTAAGATRCGIHRLTTVVSRGILLDVARALGRDVLEPGHPISPGDLDAACELAGATVEPGDILLVRTGQMVHLAPGRRDLLAYTFPSPGLTMETAEWFHARDVAAVATDTLPFVPARRHAAATDRRARLAPQPARAQVAPRRRAVEPPSTGPVRGLVVSRRGISAGGAGRPVTAQWSMRAWVSMRLRVLMPQNSKP